MLTVFLIDDHEVVRRGVVDLLEEQEDLTVIGQASSVSEALAWVPALVPDVVVLDVRLPDGNGVELCRELRSKLPDLNDEVGATADEGGRKGVPADVGGVVFFQSGVFGDVVEDPACAAGGQPAAAAVE